MINNSLKIISYRECYLSEITGVDKCITAHIKKVVSIKELNKKLNWVQFFAFQRSLPGFSLPHFCILFAYCWRLFPF